MKAPFDVRELFGTSPAGITQRPAPFGFALPPKPSTLVGMTSAQSRKPQPRKINRNTRPADTLLRDQLTRDWRVLCHDIGERRAGTEGERRAAEYIVEQLRAAGAKDARTEVFPCTSVRKIAATVMEPRGRGWRGVESAALVGAPSTPGSGTVEGPLVWLDFPEEAPRLKPGSLRGSILALFGPLPTSLDLHRRLLAAEPLAVVHVDERLPFTWTKNDGVYPYWAQHYGMLPTVTVPYQDAWRWKRDGVARLRVRVEVDPVAAESQNVMATFPGTDPSLPAVAISAHHDTQCGNVGADDNASGVLCVLALARKLRGKRCQRTVQFLSFGTEEQLSVGSAAFVRTNQVTPRTTGLLVNVDSVASPLGHFEMWVAGSEALGRFAAASLAERDVYVQLRREISPFFDTFPFNRAAIPTLGFMRPNFPGGRWQHHSSHDSLENVSVEVLAKLVEGIAPLVADLADRERWPFGSRLTVGQQAQARKLGRELLGG